jgi:hypothetical protein
MPLDKFQRIQLVRALGLNTQEDVLITSEDDWENHQSWLDRFDRYTVRSFHKDPSRTGSDPCFEIIDREEFEKHRSRLLEEGWNLIIAAPVDPADAAFAGAIMRDGEKAIVEISRGPNPIVRQVTHRGQIDDRFVVGIGESFGDSMVDEALAQIWHLERRLSKLQALRSAIYEFSYYHNPVGHKRQNVIFWEITGHDRTDPGIDPKRLTE